jgi:hypothetical protein
MEERRKTHIQVDGKADENVIEIVDDLYAIPREYIRETEDLSEEDEISLCEISDKLFDTRKTYVRQFDGSF